MPESIGFRVVIRNATDTANELVISSVGVDTGDATNRPYLTDVPSVDGASADLVAGTVDVGAATITLWDEALAPLAAIDPAGPHEHWRIKVLSVFNSGPYVELAEIEFRASSGGADQANGGTVTSSGDIDLPRTAANAFDNDAAPGGGHVDTLWLNDGVNLPAWIAYHFPAPVSVRAVMVAATDDPSRYPSLMAVEYSDTGGADDAEWVAAWSILPDPVTFWQSVVYPAPV